MSSRLGLGGPAAVELRRSQPDANLDRGSWQRRYAIATILSDLLAVVLIVVLGNLLGLGKNLPQFGDVAPGVGVVAGLLLVAGLVISRAWDPHVLGHGAEEFSRVIRAVVTGAVVLGLLGLALQATAPRPWVFGLMPAAGMLAVLFRLLLRTRLYRWRDKGRCALAVLAVGSVDCVTDLIDRTRRDHRRGWVVSGVCTPTGRASDDGTDILGVPVLGDLDAVADVACEGHYRVVAVCPTPGWSSRRLHELAWDLEDHPIELVVDPGLMEIAGPRLHVDPVDGLPLLRLTRPTFTGVPWVTKHAVDRLGSVLLLLITLPLLLAIAIAVKLDGGPVLFRQVRVGRRGRKFSMLKFRSMVVDAESRLPGLMTANDGAGPLFKMKTDPRITQVGAFLRRYSLDELPQLINVMTGSMSLVGPRPPLPNEVASYGIDARRKLMVKPGLTGLWQISGRSDLSWEQSVRLDLRYVENWNLALDGQILWKTFGAVAKSRGAY